MYLTLTGELELIAMKSANQIDDNQAQPGPESMGKVIISYGGDLLDRMRIKYASHDALPSHGSTLRSDQEAEPVSFLHGKEQIPEAEVVPAPSALREEQSGMAPQARRSLVYLLRQGVLFASQKAKLFDALCNHQADIRRHLSEVYLNLVLDENAGLAFVTDMKKEEESVLEEFADEDVVSLITRRTLSLYDTLLLLVLRKHYQDRETSGEQVIAIDQERVESYLTPFLPLTNSSKSDRRLLTPALERMVKKKILRKIRGSDDRYEITPIIRYVVNAEFLENMLGEYQKLAIGNNPAEENAAGQLIGGEQ